MVVSSRIIDVFTVKRKELVTPNYLRITFHIPVKLTERIKVFLEGSNNKLFIPPKNTKVIYFPNRENKYLTDDLISIVRTYTNRKIDLLNQ